MPETIVKTGPFTIPLDPERGSYIPILDGPPRNIALRSGMVVLKPGESVGTHNTKSYEELIVVLEGQGEMRSTSSPPLAIGTELAAFCPSETEHDVANTGTTPLRYVYVVARAAE